MKYFKTKLFYLLIHLDSRNSREAIGSNLIRFRPILRYKGKSFIFYKQSQGGTRETFRNFILDLFGRRKSFSIGLFNLRCTSSIIQVLLSRRYFTQILSKVSYLECHHKISFKLFECELLVRIARLDQKCIWDAFPTHDNELIEKFRSKISPA